MRTYGKKLTALLLALCMLLGLTACGGGGGKKDGETQQLSGTIYVPEFLSLDILESVGIDSISGGCSDGQYIYLMADVKEAVPAEEGESEEGTAVAETRAMIGGMGGSISIDAPADMTNYNWRTGLFRLSMDGKEITELENFEMTPIPEGMEGNGYIHSLRTGADGTLWVTEEVNTYSYDLPEDFDPETDDQWNYFVEGERGQYERQLDSTGSELTRVETSGVLEKLGVDWVNNTVLDGSGNIYVSTETGVTVLDKELNILFKIDGENMWGQMVQLGDGTVGMLLYPPYVEGQDPTGPSLKVIDLTAKGWGAEYPMAMGVGNIYAGTSKCLFYYDIGDSLYGYNAETSQGEKILSWVSSDINRDNLLFFTFLPDGRIAAMTREWRMNGAPKMELAVLTETDASVLADKTILTYATMYLGYDTRAKILEFNKGNSKYRIEIKDYAEYNTPTDNNAGLTKLNTEIGAGTLPDMLETSSLPIYQYGAKGVLEDLWPFIDNDPELGRDKLMTKPLEAASQNGKLYQLFSTFSIQSVVGAANVVGEEMHWTMKDLQAALATMPEGCTIFGQGDTKEGMLSTILSMNLDKFVDWTTGQCSFNSPEFISMLEFCNSFPMEFNWEDVDWSTQPDEATMIANGSQLLERAYLYRLTQFQEFRGVFGGDFTFVGYPREDGGVGSSFSIGSGIAMTTKCKDKEGAWSFMRQMLQPADENAMQYYYGDFSINKADFDKMMQEAMTPEYRKDENGEIMTDENGNPMEISKGVWFMGSEMHEEYAASQEDYDQFMALYNAIDSVRNYDDKIYEIVNEVAQSYFAGDKTVNEAADQIQSRVNLYVNEQR